MTQSCECFGKERSRRIEHAFLTAVCDQFLFVRYIASADIALIRSNTAKVAVRTENTMVAGNSVGVLFTGNKPAIRRRTGAPY